MFFCGDCKRFRQWHCDRVGSIGMNAKCNDGNTYSLHYHQDKVPQFCLDEGYYEEVENPKYRLEYEDRQQRESRKYGDNVVWSTSTA